MADQCQCVFINSPFLLIQLKLFSSNMNTIFHVSVEEFVEKSFPSSLNLLFWSVAQGFIYRVVSTKYTFKIFNRDFSMSKLEPTF